MLRIVDAYLLYLVPSIVELEMANGDDLQIDVRTTYNRLGSAEMITKRMQKVGNSRGVIFSPEMRQHLDNAEVVEVVYTPEGLLIKKADPQAHTIEDVGARAMKKYPKTLKRLAK